VHGDAEPLRRRALLQTTKKIELKSEKKA